MTIYFSHLSGINVGIITTLWTTEPLFSAILDWIIYGQRLFLNHIMGIIFVVAGAICIGLSGASKKKDSVLHAPNYAPPVSVDGSGAFNPTLVDP